MPAPSEEALLRQAKDRLVVGTSRELQAWTRRSHLADGRCVAWAGDVPPGVDLAVDAEQDLDVPRALAQRFGREDFWGRWTRLECASKLSGVPVILLATGDLTPPVVPGAVAVTLRLPGGIIASVVTHPRPSPVT